MAHFLPCFSPTGSGAAPQAFQTKLDSIANRVKAHRAIPFSAGQLAVRAAAPYSLARFPPLAGYHADSIPLAPVFLLPGTSPPTLPVPRGSRFQTPGACPAVLAQAAAPDSAPDSARQSVSVPLPPQFPNLHSSKIPVWFSWNSSAG